MSTGPLDDLITKILVDCYGEDEELTAFLTIFDDEVQLPTEAMGLGTSVTITGFDYSDGRRELTAHCRSPHDVQRSPWPTSSSPTARLPRGCTPPTAATWA